MTPLPRTRSRRGRVIDFAAILAEAPSFLQTALGGEPPEVTSLHSGVSSANFLVSHSTGLYVLRLEAFREMADIELDIAVIEACRQAGVSVIPSPIMLEEWNGFPTLLRPYVEGMTLKEARALDAASVRAAGRELGRIHATPQHPNREWFYERAVTEPGGIRSSGLDAAPAARHAIMRLQPKMQELFDAGRGLVHSDFKADNLVLSQDRIVVLDWEKATAGPQLFDLALAVFHLLAVEDRKIASIGARAFVAGYLGENPPGGEFLADLPSAVLYSASIFYLIDLEIASRTVRARDPSTIDLRHLLYYRSYCLPAYSRLIERSSWVARALNIGSAP